MTGRIDIGLKSRSELTSFPFGIAQIQAIFQAEGNC